MASGGDNMDVKKALFTSPAVKDSNDSPATSQNDNIQLEQDIDEFHKRSQKEAHEKRMKKFRKMAKQLEEDDWQYPPIEKLIGLKWTTLSVVKSWQEIVK